MEESTATSGGLYGAGGLYGIGPSEGRWIWVGGMASDVSETQLTERIGAHQAREGSGSTFVVHRMHGGAWVQFTRSSLAHVCLTALNGTVLTGPKGSSSTLRVRYAAHLEDTSAPPHVTYLKRPLPSAATTMDEPKKKANSGAGAPSPRVGTDAPPAKRAKTNDDAVPPPPPQASQPGSAATTGSSGATAGGGAKSETKPAATASKAAAATSKAATAASSRPSAAAGTPASVPLATGGGGGSGGGSSAAVGAARASASTVAGGSRGASGGQPAGQLPGGPATHADMLRLALRSALAQLLRVPPAVPCHPAPRTCSARPTPAILFWAPHAAPRAHCHISSPAKPLLFVCLAPSPLRCPSDA